MEITRQGFLKRMLGTGGALTLPLLLSSKPAWARRNALFNPGTVKQIFLPEEANFLGSAFPAYLKNNGTNFPVSGLAYDATTDEAAFWKFQALNYEAGNLTLDLYWYADTATIGNVVWEVQLAAITANTDTQDIETKALATLNFVQDTHLGTTGQRVHLCTITISNLDSIAADDICWLRIARDANGTNATDDMTGDAILVMAELSYSDV